MSNIWLDTTGNNYLDTLNNIWFDLGGVATPVILPSSGEYPSTQLISISTTTSGADIYYTTDGSIPDSGDNLYSVPFALDSAKTIKAIGIKSGLTDSDIVSETYTIASVETPVADPLTGSYTYLETIELSTLTAGASIYYTLDGTTPTAASTLYTVPIPMFKGTLKVIGIKAGYIDSSIVTYLYSILEDNAYCVAPDVIPFCISSETDPFCVSPETDPYCVQPLPACCEIITCPCVPIVCSCESLEDCCLIIPEPSPLPDGEWVAALEQRGSKYVYVYDIDNYAIVKIDTSETNPKVVDWLVVNDADYDLDYDMGYGSFPGSQRGSYCISKEYNKIWYLFRKPSDGSVKLVEIDLTEFFMVVTKQTIFPAVVPGETFSDACADDDYAFFATNKLSGRILRFDTAHSLLDKEFNYSATGFGDEGINSITLNPVVNEIAWVYTRVVPFSTAYYPYTDFNFNVRTTVSRTEGGVDSSSWQNFLRYDEKFDSIFYQRAYWPVNGIAYYFSTWEMYNNGGGFIQGLQYMQQYLGGDLDYFYVLHQNNADQKLFLHRFEQTDTTIYVAAIPGIQVEVTSYLQRFGRYFSNSIYNELSDKSCLIAYNSVDGGNYIATFNSSLVLISDFAPDTIYWGE